MSHSGDKGAWYGRLRGNIPLVLDVLLISALLIAFVIVIVAVGGMGRAVSEKAVMQVRAVAFFVFFFFAIASWYLVGIVDIHGFRAWCRGWTVWSLVPAARIAHDLFRAYAGGITFALPLLSAVNTCLFLLASLELGWPGKHERNQRSAVVVFTVALIGTLPNLLAGGRNQYLEWVASILDGALSLVVATTLGIALMIRVLRGSALISEERDGRRPKVFGLIILAIMLAFGAFQVFLSLTYRENNPSAWQLITANASPALIGLALFTVMTAEAYRLLKARLWGAEFSIDDEFVVVGANRVANEIVGINAEQIVGRKLGEILFRFLVDLEEMRDALEKTGQFGPRVVVCKRARGERDVIEEVRRIVSAERMKPGSGVYSVIHVGLAEVGEARESVRMV